jgi:hypothetical protein
MFMSVTTQTPHTPTPLARVRRRLANCDRLRRTAAPFSIDGAAPVNRVVATDPGRNRAGRVETPAGPEAAEHALAWLARQARWQSTFAELERP